MELARGEIAVASGERQWAQWILPPDTAIPATGYIRFDLTANLEVCWHVAGAIEPGHVSAFEMAPGKMRRYSSGVTMAMLVDPPQCCFSAENVISGQARPHVGTNLWRSDPDESLPQWLELAWSDLESISAVELVFAGHLLREYHAYSPFYRDPQCVSDYDIQYQSGNDWKTLISVSGNYQRHRKHPLEKPVETRRIRVVVLATNGDRSAAIYELRVY
jgi:hypothetical protein